MQSQTGNAIKELLSEYFNDRPAGVVVDTLVLHSMHNPDVSDSLSVSACKSRLDEFGVSAHYLIALEGTVFRLVDENKRAWHAGESRLFADDKRSDVNNFSIGVELIGTHDEPFTDSQYAALKNLSLSIFGRHPVKYICGHVHVSPNRKSDPWGFDWARYRKDLGEVIDLESFRFPKEVEL